MSESSEEALDSTLTALRLLLLLEEHGGKAHMEVLRAISKVDDDPQALIAALMLLTHTIARRLGQVTGVPTDRLLRDLQAGLTAARDLVTELDSMTEVTEIFGGETIRTHTKDRCAGGPCCIHNPSDHPLRDLPLHWRPTIGLMERICRHGVGHPDPDSLHYETMVYGVDYAKARSVHGCCPESCCREADHE